ncbi:MAG: DegT/DnrJ/EryC1/StrS family aminotransferase [Myxococcales bacterium]|nr:DegT/DnrJ/EryC1/StrS family aminotransferase [Myxococcales bacterium]
MELFNSHVSDEAIRLAVDVLRSGRLSEGPVARSFEQALERSLGLVRPRLVNSGTSALHLSLVAAGVGPGDEVILPPQTFVASGLSVLMAGARPVFADIDATTGNLDVSSAASRITERTKAVMPVHWAGIPCEMDEIGSLAQQHGLAVVEDAAHALGALYKGTPVGAISRFTCFSFQAIKHLTTGDGGAICSLSEQDERTVSRLRWFGIDRATAVPDELGERQYNLSDLGFKYHMNDLAAAVGMGNLASFPERLRRRRDIALAYFHHLAEVPGLTLPAVHQGSSPSWWLFTVLVEQRLNLVRKLKEHGIPCSVVHRRIDRNRVLGGVTPELPGQERFDAQQLSLPCHEEITEEDVHRIVECVKSGW